MKSIIALVGLLLINSSASAQIVLHTQAPLQPTCKLTWDHDSLDANGNPTTLTGWALTINGVKANLTNVTPSNFPTTLTTYSIPCPAFLIGNSIIVVWVRNSVGETPTSEIQLIVDPPPLPKVAPRPASGVKMVNQ